jgi:hypothetical protein
MMNINKISTVQIFSLKTFIIHIIINNLLLYYWMHYYYYFFYWKLYYE